MMASGPDANRPPHILLLMTLLLDRGLPTMTEPTLPQKADGLRLHAWPAPWPASPSGWRRYTGLRA